MDLDEVSLTLRELAKLLAAKAPTAEWYLFGSAVRRVPLPSDIDVVIVYSNISDARELREGLRSYSESVPLHLLLLRQDEENELQFVRDQRAIRIFPEEVSKR
jgi:predicted nucleotidyltransferase